MRAGIISEATPSSLAGVAEAEGVKAPAVIVIGEVATLYRDGSEGRMHITGV